jgi:hemerythrin
MPILKWTDSLSVGVREIDAQHKTLIMNLNELFDAMKQGKANTMLKFLLSKLVAYTQMHFSTEEKYMKQWNYKEYAAHKAEHDAFVKKVADFKGEYDQGKTLLSVEVLTFLKDWVANHIQVTDKKYSSLFNEHGL